MFHFDYDAGRWVFDRLTCKSRVSKLFLARIETTTKGTGTFVVVLARCVGGNVCKSNTSKTFCTPRNGFEDRRAHRSPSVPKRGGILPNRICRNRKEQCGNRKRSDLRPPASLSSTVKRTASRCSKMLMARLRDTPRASRSTLVVAAPLEASIAVATTSRA